MDSEEKSILVPEVRHSFSGSALRELRGPIVYLFRKGTCILYIGVSNNGLARALAPEHHIRALRDLDPNAVLDIYIFDTLEAALLAEREMISLHRPMYNKHHNKEGISWKMPKRKYQRKAAVAEVEVKLRCAIARMDKDDPQYQVVQNLLGE